MPSPDRAIRAAAVFGTRPEAIKLLSVFRTLAKDDRFDVRVLLTGQHKEMVDDILKPFGVAPHGDLAIMRPGQTLNEIVSRSMPRLDQLYTEERPDIVMVQGDTTSAFCAALAAFHRKIPVAHVEAGLRSFDRFHPFPEESNRRMISAIADLHLAPTAGSAANLRSEHVGEEGLFVTGNTVIDALLLAVNVPVAADSAQLFTPRGDGRRVLITLHRRESWDNEQAGGGGASVLDGILLGIRQTAEAHPGVDFVYPVHLNPKVREAAARVLGQVGNVHLIAPLSYLPFVQLMASACAIITDSGGVQEEAPSLGIPVLVPRKTTERPEGLLAGTNRLVGTNAEDIRRELERLLDSPRPRPKNLPCPSPFGDGKASDRIRQAILHFFGRADRPQAFEAPAPAPVASS